MMLATRENRVGVESMLRVADEVKLLVRASIEPLMRNSTVDEFASDLYDASGIKLSTKQIHEFWDMKFHVSTIVTSHHLGNLERALLSPERVKSSSSITTLLIIASLDVRDARLSMPKAHAHST